MYEYEINKIKSVLDPDVVTSLAECGAILAGGAITSIFTGKEINDFDIYFKDAEGLYKFILDIYSKSAESNLSIYELRVVHTTKKSVLCTDASENKIQLICYKTFEDISTLFRAFDFYHNMGAYDFKEDKIILHDKFMSMNARRALEFNHTTDYPLVSAIRVQKYVDRGYSISKAQMLRILFAVAKKNFKDWESVKGEVGSMYGIAIDDLFDTTKEFSIDSVIEQLDQKHINESFSGVIKDYDLCDVITNISHSITAPDNIANWIRVNSNDKGELRSYPNNYDPDVNYSEQGKAKTSPFEQYLDVL